MIAKKKKSLLNRKKP